jgi:cytochrome c oxidase subunit II
MREGAAGLVMEWLTPGDSWWMPANAARHGVAVDTQMRQSLEWMIALLVLAHVILLLGWMRRRALHEKSVRAGMSPWTAGAFVLVTILFTVLVVRAERLWAANRYQGASPEAMQVEVVGEQFAWYFRYPGPDARFGEVKPGLVNAAEGNPLGIAASDAAGKDDFVTSELVLPVGHEVDLRIRALDVVHGFFIPAMRLKQNALPGSTLHVHFTPTKVGEFPIVCSQVCGTGHYRMEAKLRVVSEAEFREWTAAREAAGRRP